MQCYISAGRLMIRTAVRIPGLVLNYNNFYTTLFRSKTDAAGGIARPFFEYEKWLSFAVIYNDISAASGSVRVQIGSQTYTDRVAPPISSEQIKVH